MGLPEASESEDLSSKMEVDAFRRLFPLRYFERHLAESIRPDARPVGRARDTTVSLGAVACADGSALAKIGSTTMLAAIKMEVMTPSLEAPDEGCVAIDFHLPPICSPNIRPGRPAEAAPVISKQLSDTILSSGMINLKELSLVSGKAAWMVYLDIYCLDADGALFDAALLSAVAACSHLQIPVVSLDFEGKIVMASGEQKVEKLEKEAVNKERRKLTLSSIPLSLTCILHKKHILVDPTAEEESIMDTLVTVVLDSSGQLVSLYKPGGPVLAYTSAVQLLYHCRRRKNINSFSLRDTNSVKSIYYSAKRYPGPCHQKSFFKSLSSSKFDLIYPYGTLGNPTQPMRIQEIPSSTYL